MLCWEWTEQVEKLFDDLGRSTPNDVPVIVKKEALDQASCIVAVFLAWRIVLSYPGKWHLDDRCGLAVVEDKGIGIGKHPDKGAHQVIAACGEQIVQLAAHLHMGRPQTNILRTLTQGGVLQGRIMHFMPSPRKGNLSAVVIHGIGALGKDHAVVAVVLIQGHEDCGEATL